MMKKSKEIIKIEKSIEKAHKDSFDIAIQMIQKEFGGDMEKAMNDGAFISRIHRKTNPLWDDYINGYSELKKLEKKEGYPAMKAYAAQLDAIDTHLSEKNKKLCHYPFSGIDFYWARIFDKIVFEDISFYKEKCANAWWGEELYTQEKMNNILSLMKKQKIIDKHSQLDFLVGDAEEPRKDNNFNNSKSTLVLKSHVSGYLEMRFNDEPLKYGAIIIANSSEKISKINTKLAKEKYDKVKFIKGEKFCTPFAMGLKNIHIFLK